MEGEWSQKKVRLKKKAQLTGLVQMWFGFEKILMDQNLRQGFSPLQNQVSLLLLSVVMVEVVVMVEKWRLLIPQEDWMIEKHVLISLLEESDG